MVISLMDVLSMYSFFAETSIDKSLENSSVRFDRLEKPVPRNVEEDFSLAGSSTISEMSPKLAPERHKRRKEAHRQEVIVFENPSVMILSSENPVYNVTRKWQPDSINLAHHIIQNRARLISTICENRGIQPIDIFLHKVYPNSNHFLDPISIE